MAPPPTPLAPTVRDVLARRSRCEGLDEREIEGGVVRTYPAGRPRRRAVDPHAGGTSSRAPAHGASGVGRCESATAEEGATGGAGVGPACGHGASVVDRGLGGAAQAAA